MCKRHFACNGTVVDHSEWGEVIQFQGDQRDNISRFLLGVKLARVEQIKVHGFWDDHPISNQQSDLNNNNNKIEKWFQKFVILLVDKVILKLKNHYYLLI